MAKRALTVGINYPGQSHSLRGCVNDSDTIVDMLRTNFGFAEEEITQVLDNDATTARIKQELHNLVNGAKPGDILFFHYSGHGTQIIDDDDPDHEPDGLDEVICPVDFNWRDKVVRDDDLKSVFDSVPEGVNLTVFLDCCNSGGGFDAVNEYQADVTEDEGSREGIGGTGRFLEPPEEIKAKIQTSGLVPKKRNLSRKVNATGMLISGAQAHQTAADARINGKYQGATTYALQQALSELGPTATYHQIVHSLNRFMVHYGFSQRPQLDGPEKLHDRVFLSEYDFGDPNAVAVHVWSEPAVEDEPFDPAHNEVDKPVSNVTVDSSHTVNIGGDPEPEPAPEPEKKDDKKDDDDNKKKYLIIGAAVLAVVVIVVTLFA